MRRQLEVRGFLVMVYQAMQSRGIAWRGRVEPTEGQKIAWVRAQNLRDYPMPAADEPLIPLLQDWL